MAEESRNRLYLFFEGLVGSVFQGQLGVVDPSVNDYLSKLLLKYVRLNRLTGVGSADRSGFSISDRLAWAQQKHVRARGGALQGVGDFALFMTGVYPESLRRSSADFYLLYCDVGRQCYKEASSYEEIRGDLVPLLVHLSYDFQLFAYGLRKVRQQWEQPDEPPPRILLFD